MKIHPHIREAFSKYSREDFLDYMKGVMEARCYCSKEKEVLQAYRIIRFFNHKRFLGRMPRKNSGVPFKEQR